LSSDVEAGDTRDATVSPKNFFGQNLEEILAKFEQIWAKVIKIWTNLFRFGQNQNLASPKTLDLLLLRGRSIL